MYRCDALGCGVEGGLEGQVRRGDQLRTMLGALSEKDRGSNEGGVTEERK